MDTRRLGITVLGAFLTTGVGFLTSGVYAGAIFGQAAAGFTFIGTLTFAAAGGWVGYQLATLTRPPGAPLPGAKTPSGV
jgi:hypothetical protein